METYNDWGTHAPYIDKDVFAKLKHLSKYESSDIELDNFEYALRLALVDISSGDMYKHLRYI